MFVRPAQAWAALVVLCISVPAMAVASISPVVVTPGADVGPDYAVNQTDVAYTASGPGGNKVMYFKSRSGGVPITIVGSAFGATSLSELSLNDVGDIAFQAVGDPASTGIFVRSSGGNIITINGNGFDAPALAENGDIVFRGIGAGGSTEILTRSSDGSIITLMGSGFARLGRPAINEGLHVAVDGDDGDGEGLFVRSAGGTVLTIRGDNFKFYSPPQIGDEVLCFGASNNVGDSGLFAASLSSGAISPISDFGLSRSIFHVMNGNGDVVSLVESAGQQSLRHYGHAGGGAGGSVWLESPVLAVGDPFMGSTIASLSLSPDAMLEDGSFVFFAMLDNGESGLFYAVVPEPSTMAMLALAGFCGMRRRKLPRRR